MLNKLSFAIPIDNCGVFLVKLIQIYKNLYGQLNVFTKIAIQKTRPKNKWKKKKKKKFFIAQTKQIIKTPDCTTIRFNKNAGVLLKKRLQPLGKTITGTTSYTIKRKKFLKSFVKIL